MAGAGGFEPPHGGTKIASCCSGINVGSDSSRCVHIKAHQWVSTTVGTTLPPAPSANVLHRPSARCRRGVAVSNRRLPPAKAMCLDASTVQAPYKMGAIKTQPFKMSPHCGTGHSMPRWGPAVPTLPRNPRRTSHEKDCVRDRHGYGLGLGSVGPGGAKWCGRVIEGRGATSICSTHPASAPSPLPPCVPLARRASALPQGMRAGAWLANNAARIEETDSGVPSLPRSLNLPGSARCAGSPA